VKGVLDLFKSDGALAAAIPGFESRPQQLSMASDVASVFADGGVLLVEAGTGIGKSIAYLVPALVAAAASGKQTVISTHTIALQEQLIYKDIPLLAKALGIDERAIVMKGMGNYLCRRRLDDAMAERRGYTVDERLQVEQLHDWSVDHEEGSRTEFGFQTSRSTWDKVRMEGDACSHSECPHFRRCFFFKARREAEGARLLIVNHHLLLADLAIRMEGQNGILPQYDHLIVDEAHNLEEVASETFAMRLSQYEGQKLLRRLLLERAGQGKLSGVAERLRKLNVEGADELLHRIEFDLHGEKRELSQLFGEVFGVYYRFFARHAREERLRLHPSHRESGDWLDEIQPATAALVDKIGSFVLSIRAIDEKIDLLLAGRSDDRLRSLRLDTGALVDRLERFGNKLYEFVFGENDPSSVRWLEAPHQEVRLVGAKLDVAPLLNRWLFSSTTSTVLSSATLAAHGSFRFIRGQLGIGEEFQVTERVYDSPFDYQSQALLGIPVDLPLPSDRSFALRASEAMLETVRASGGGAFLLFTSFRMLAECYDSLQGVLKEEGFNLFRQGEMERHPLLEAFKSSPRAVLFGTDSFWEGVDVVGAALKCVIMTKLPFRAPTDPLMEARLERIAEEGKDPFFHFSVPQAIVRFKQGFGRLIRNGSDRGCILCLDSRLTTKGYGKLFLRSLPPSLQVTAPLQEVMEKIRDFYKQF
jgi:ATP-dependent DNA helicase DinG